MWPDFQSCGGMGGCRPAYVGRKEKQMDYREAMQMLSQCGLGVLVADADERIIEANDAAEQLLQDEGKLEGCLLADIAPAFCRGQEGQTYANTAFGEYRRLCPAPTVEGLPADCRLVVFRDATNDVCHEVLMHAINQVSESVIICDADNRIWLLNDAAVKMDSIVTQDVVGENIANVYRPQDGKELLVPQVIADRRPLLNVRQYYSTRYGKNVDIVASSFPVIQDRQVLGGFSIMEDWSAIDSLHKQIIDLQQKLVERSEGRQKTKSALSAKYTFADIIYISKAVSSVVAQCRQVAKTDSSVMIYGETGTGKELFAQSIHNASPRSDGPFLAINCAAIPENLLESLLFGTEKGAYTGAERRAGLFEQADGGTLLLDEINSMNINLQSKLLRVLQDGVIRRVGGMNEIQVDVRVLSNINMPPYEAIEKGRLRRDLFYRLGVVNINVPPLRERREDIPLLAKHFILQCNQKLVRAVRDIDEQTLARFTAYDWPGNVRELQHAIEHAMNILPDGAAVITPEYLPAHITAHPGNAFRTSRPVPEGGSLSGTMQEMERRAICKVLRENGGNISESARVLQMSRQRLQYRIKRYKINIDALLDNPPR